MMCRYFTMCENKAVCVVETPAVRAIPTCHRCALKAELWGTEECRPRITFGYADAGCYLDGAQGWRNAGRVVDLAHDNGMHVTDEQWAHVNAFLAGSDDENVHLAISDRGELSDLATDYLSAITADGMVWEWDAGELSLLPLCQTEAYEDEECPHCERPREVGGLLDELRQAERLIR